ncbi:diguanylate cyclase (GGDEF)-like protein [Novosphingobium sp. PhB55]|uniref:putative bifunctional diguanylate cyclase/phosphodiesterase n=1 Tax=Novosphingobium sp. PhB55 TaxID=2485106 RepID=UPI0010D3D04F|nr:bifunctional diguanylate cyclase/phosphodiesterase [Novosphingobium sp. PhB55]TDW67366.1 diguanylate cyclase (GGDEF)-like protein [Novosphingobium sp. PhB55]
MMSNTNSGFARFFASLETRLVGALCLIAALSVLLQVVTQREAFALRKESDGLIAVSALAENADQFAEAVGKLRMATNRGLVASNATSTSDELTDSAIAIGDQLAKLRSSGAALSDLPEASNPFADLDRHVSAILEVQAGGAGGKHLIARIESRNNAMGRLADALVLRIHANREAAQKRLIASIERWQMLVFGTGLVTILVVLLVLFGILRNILPAIRRMHGYLQGLADGDLDLEIGAFKLKELKALSGPLETFRKNAKAVKNLAFSDAATGLPNRRAFQEDVGRLLAAGEDRRFACMLIDIDRFKHINDDYGHAAGDELVRLIGLRMKAILGPDGIIARVGGDEFALCLPLQPERDGLDLANRLVDAAREPFSLGEYAVAITVSLGVVDIASAPEVEIDETLRNADMALYASKKNGRNCATAFSPSMAEERAIDRALEKDLESAFEKQQLRMVYQPIHSVHGNTREVEALVRWRHPELGDVPPSTFIPAAERSGLMVRLGEWIIQRALNDFARWPDMDMSINLSPLQLQHDGFSAFLVDCCARYGVDPRRLFLEVTESLSIERNTRALLTLNMLRNLGFRIALDDFGTGYSSLSMVKSFKFDRMKLDRSLVMDLGQDPASVAVLEAAVTMARHVGAEVVAEGISDAHLIGATKSAGCTHLQGYFYSRPIEADDVSGYFESSGERTAELA